MKYLSMLIAVCLLSALSALSTFSNELPVFHFPSGGEIFRSSDSLEIVFDNCDSLTSGYSLYIWKQTTREWLLLKDSVNLSKGIFQILLPSFQSSYARFKIADYENNSFSISNYFSLKTEYYKVNYLDNSQINDNPDFVVYPNPAHDVLFINVNEKIGSAKLFDYLGKDMDIIRYDNRIEFRQLPTGVYFLYFETKNNKSYFTKVIVN